MTNAELIAHLQKLPPDLPVYLDGHLEYEAYTCSVLGAEVEVTKFGYLTPRTGSLSDEEWDRPVTIIRLQNNNDIYA